jgi:uncharacterized protein (DUF58 family)
VRRLAASFGKPLCLLLLAAAMGAGAATIPSLALFAAGVGLALLTACAGVSVALAPRRVTVARTVLGREVQENDPVRVRFDAHGGDWLGVRLEVEIDPGTWVEIARAGSITEVTVERRGEYRLLRSRVRVRDALGIFERSWRVGSVEPILILPTPAVPANRNPSRPATGGDPEPDGLQEHSPGTPLARIHWPALARGAGLQVRRFAAAPGGLPLVVVDTAGARDVFAVDWAARTAAGHILALTRSGGCRVVLPGDVSETTVIGLEAGWRPLHRRLARLAGSLQAPAWGPAAGAAAIVVRASAAPPGPAGPLPRPLPQGVVPAATNRSEVPA